MNKEVEEKRRELFEAWRASSGMTGFRETAWAAFNAALDLVDIKLPKPCAYESLDSARVFVQLTYEIGSDTADPVALVRLNDCRAAINQTCLGLRISE